MTEAAKHRSTYIDERGWWCSLSAPPTEPRNRAARLARVEQVFNALAPVSRPLALEAELCWRELDTGLPAFDPPEPPLIAAVSSSLPTHVVVRSTVAEPPPVESLPALSPSSIRNWLEQWSQEDRPEHILDWFSLESVAVEVRASVPTPELRIEQLGLAVQGLERDERYWLAGPVASEGFGVWPPLRIRIRAEDTAVQLTVVAYWALWSRAGSQEHEDLESAFSNLEVHGWRREDCA